VTIRASDLPSLNYAAMDSLRDDELDALLSSLPDVDPDFWLLEANSGFDGVESSLPTTNTTNGISELVLGVAP
jgi:hypothetical protein